MTIVDSQEVLSEQECRALLEGETIGRIGVSLDALPAILLVNYSIVDGGILFRAGEGSKLRAALSDTVVAFEVDHTDPDRDERWSVLVVGVAEPVDDAVEAPGDHGVPAPRAGGQSHHLIRIRPQLISGRRVAHPIRPAEEGTPTLPRAAYAARRAMTVSRSASLREASALLGAEPAGAGIVQDPGTPIEVVAMRDIVRAIAAGADPDASTVADLTLERRPYLAGATELPPALARVLASGTGEALVLDEDGLVGLATISTLCASVLGRHPDSSQTGQCHPPSWPRTGPTGLGFLDPAMEIWVDRRAAVTTVSVAGRLDEGTAKALADVLNGLIKDCGGIVRVDLRSIERRSPGGTGALRAGLAEAPGRTTQAIDLQPASPDRRTHREPASG
jgi:CBS domain-containing protein